MNENRLIENVVRLPEKFYSLGNRSMYSLLQETGYFKVYDQVTEMNILEKVAEFSGCIEQWLHLSEDKRSSSGWYFKQNENGKYCVGYFPDKKDYQQREYSDIKQACAYFIKKEIEEIRKA